jgi:hypothetical protein
VDLTIWQKWSLQKWKSELGEILKHLAFHKGTPNILFMSFLLQKTDGKAAAQNTVTWKSLTMSHDL